MKKCVSLLWAAVLLSALLLPLPSLADDPPAFTSSRSLPDAMQGVYYATRITVSGTNAITLSFSPGDYTAHSVPKGLTMDQNGLIYGTPQKAGTYSFVVAAVDNVIPAQATDIFSLTVLPFDEGALNAGGSNAGIIGAGFDDLTGVANAINGGLAAMGEGLLFFVDSKGYLMQSAAPFKKASRTYGAVEYDCLDTLGSDLYYFHHYLAQRGQEGESFYIVGRGRVNIPGTKNQYITRIVQDSIGKKGRIALVMLDRRISNLSLTHEIALYIENGLLKRTGLENGKENTLRAYAAGQEIQAASAFAYNGFAYFTGKDDGRLYRIPLDGQVAQPLSAGRVTAFTAASNQGEPALYYADANRQLFRAGLDGANPQAVEGLKAGALNADAGFVYFTNAADNNRVYRLTPGSEIAQRLSETPAKSIYVFDTYLAFEPQSGNALFILPKEGGTEARLAR